MRPSIFALLLTQCFSLIAQDTAPPAGWTATASLADARSSACAVRLADGRILVAGGLGAAGFLSSVELYLPEGSFMPAARMNSARARHTCTLLKDGRVLAAGGDADGVGSAEVYDPEADTWQLVAGTGQARAGHTAALLADGRVLIAGGESPDGPLDSVEIFDRANSSLSIGPKLGAARTGHSAITLDDGSVLIAGGRGAQDVLASTEIFNPTDGSFHPGPDLAVARRGHSATALDEGRVLVAGGTNGATELDSAEIYDPATTTFQLLDAKLQTPRRDHLALLIPGNGGVLLAGGIRNDQALAATELFLPVENTFLALGSLTAARTGLVGAAVGDGMILAAGGVNENGPQSACGVLLVPAIQFIKNPYHPTETVQASGSFFPPSTTVTFSLDFVSPSVTQASNSRLITTSVTTPGSTFNVRVGFPAVAVVLAAAADAGKAVRLTGRTSGGITAVASVPVKIATTLTLSLPQPEYEGFDATFLTQLTRAFNPVPITGTLQLTVSTSTIIDAISNTLNPDASTQTLNTTNTSVILSRAVSNLPDTRLNVVAGYSGDAAHESAVATASYTAVSKTPVVRLAADPPAPQAGVPFTLTATVQAQSAIPAHTMSGTVSFFQSGFLLGTDSPPLSFSGGPPGITVNHSFTALTLNPLSVSATYNGDGFFHSASSQTINVAVQKAVPVITFVNPPTSYQCGLPGTFNVSMAFPSTLGLGNRTVTLQAFSSDGSVRGVTPTVSGTLVPSATTLGTAAATMTATLPVDTSSIRASFSGDSLLAAVTTASSRLSLQPSPVTVQLVNGASTVTNPARLTARVTSTQCGAAIGGTIEFLDGTSSLAVVAVAPTVFSGSPPVTGDATLTVSRPVGLHNISVKYSGDSHYQPATSAPVALVFQ